MIIALLLMAVFIVLSFFTFRAWVYKLKPTGRNAYGNIPPTYFEDFLFGSICYIVITLASVFLIFGLSYNSYLTTRSFYTATVSQYRGAISLYQDNSVVLDLGQAVLTDLKYQGYQESMTKFIMDLRNSIIRYNTVIIQKRAMGHNPWVGWFIVQPDEDMKIIETLK